MFSRGISVRLVTVSMTAFHFRFSRLFVVISTRFVLMPEISVRNRIRDVSIVLK